MYDTDMGPEAPVMEPKEIEVTISITLSKTVKIKVSDYDVVDSEDHSKKIDYSNCDLKKAVKDQLYLPQDAGLVLENSDIAALEAIADEFSNWEVDDFEVIL